MPEQHLEQPNRCCSVALGAVPPIEGNIERFTELAQTIGWITGNELAARSNGAERLPEVIVSQPAQLFLDEIEIEPHVVGNKDGIFRYLEHIAGHVGKNGGIGHHRVRNTGQVPDKRGNGTSRIEQRVKRVDNLLSIMTKNSDFSQSGWAIYAPGGFYVNDTIHEK